MGAKWFSDKASDEDVIQLDQLINKRAEEGWELAMYSYMATSTQIRGAFLVTFKKRK